MSQYLNLAPKNNTHLSSNAYANTSEVTTIRANTQDTRQQNQPEYSGIVYINKANPVTPRMIFDRILESLPENIKYQVSERWFMSSLKTQLTLLTAISYKFNFLIAETALQLSAGQDRYKLPLNYDKMIAVYLPSDCKLNFTKRKIELAYIDYAMKNFPDGQNFYSLKNNEIYFINMSRSNSLELCQHCGHCGHCKEFSGQVNLQYYATIPIPQSIDEQMVWYPSHPAMTEYLKEAIIPEIYQKAQLPAPINPNKEIFYNTLLESDRNLLQENNKQEQNNPMFSWSGLRF